MTEIWKTIENYETYSISNLGQVRNNKTMKLKNSSINTVGYLDFDLYKNNKRKHHSLHRLLAIAFIPNPNGCSDVDHMDNNRTNNCLSNLRWATRTENLRNSQIRSTNTSGFKGISFHKLTKKWRSSITIDGILIELGLYETIEEATLARQSKANEVFGIFTNICEQKLTTIIGPTDLTNG
jgi:hypothetical protein